MRTKSMRRLLTAGALLAAVTGAGCSDLSVEPRSAVTSGNIFSDPNSYRSFLAKLYGGLILTGQNGPDGNGDISGVDEGTSQYLRGVWNLQQLPTDETILGWGDPGVPELVFQTWGPQNPLIYGMYSRIFYQVALANQFLRETSDQALSTRGGVSAELRQQIQLYRTEARFIRALAYFHAVDLFGNVPIVDETFNVDKLPTQATRAQVFQYVESELNAIRGQLPTRTQVEYGRASQAAADMILAHLYLNAQVWAGAPRYADARAAAERVIAAGYTLDDNYLDIFSADNNSSPEIIFAAPQDGLRTRTWGGMTLLIHGAVGGDMNAGNYGIDGGWWGMRLRPETYRRFAAGDGRAAYFFTQNQSVEINDVGSFQQGIAAPKFRNITSTGAAGSNPTHPDTDFPVFRLGDAYLIYAEAVVRGGGGTRAQALQYVNALRQRAFGNASGNITDEQLTADFLLDERSRELLWEATRRRDLVRYDRFAGPTYVWSWKGGVRPGVQTPVTRNLYPIPSNELSANPNVKQNPGY